MLHLWLVDPKHDTRRINWYERRNIIVFVGVTLWHIPRGRRIVLWYCHTSVASARPHLAAASKVGKAEGSALVGDASHDNSGAGDHETVGKPWRNCAVVVGEACNHDNSGSTVGTYLDTNGRGLASRTPAPTPTARKSYRMTQHPRITYSDGCNDPRNKEPSTGGERQGK
jgi:hypothetical protein